MAHNDLSLSDARYGRRRRLSLQDVLSWLMVLIVVLAASAGFSLDHLLPIVP
jgi:hypothetical protein